MLKFIYIPICVLLLVQCATAKENNDAQTQTITAYAIEAKVMLRQVCALQETYHYLYEKYSNDLERIGFEQSELLTEGGKARYKISIEMAASDSYLVMAKSVEDFDGDGQFNVWQIDQNKVLKELIKD